MIVDGEGHRHSVGVPAIQEDNDARGKGRKFCAEAAAAAIGYTPSRVLS